MNLSTNEQKLKNRIYELETVLLEKTSQYKKDQISCEGKIKFIEQQRDTLKKEQNESNKRFETMLDTIQKKVNQKKKISKIMQNYQLKALNKNIKNK